MRSCFSLIIGNIQNDDMDFGSLGFNMDSFLDFGFSGDWDEQQEWV